MLEDLTPNLPLRELVPRDPPDALFGRLVDAATTVPRGCCGTERCGYEQHWDAAVPPFTVARVLKLLCRLVQRSLAGNERRFHDLERRVASLEGFRETESEGSRREPARVKMVNGPVEVVR